MPTRHRHPAGPGRRPPCGVRVSVGVPSRRAAAPPPRTRRGSARPGVFREVRSTAILRGRPSGRSRGYSVLAPRQRGVCVAVRLSRGGPPGVSSTRAVAAGPTHDDAGRSVPPRRTSFCLGTVSSPRLRMRPYDYKSCFVPRRSNPCGSRPAVTRGSCQRSNHLPSTPGRAGS